MTAPSHHPSIHHAQTGCVGRLRKHGRQGLGLEQPTVAQADGAAQPQPRGDLRCDALGSGCGCSDVCCGAGNWRPRCMHQAVIAAAGALGGRREGPQRRVHYRVSPRKCDALAPRLCCGGHGAPPSWPPHATQGRAGGYRRGGLGEVVVARARAAKARVAHVRQPPHVDEPKQDRRGHANGDAHGCRAQQLGRKVRQEILRSVVLDALPVKPWRGGGKGVVVRRRRPHPPLPTRHATRTRKRLEQDDRHGVVHAALALHERNKSWVHAANVFDDRHCRERVGG